MLFPLPYYLHYKPHASVFFQSVRAPDLAWRLLETNADDAESRGIWLGLVDDALELLIITKCKPMNWPVLSWVGCDVG